MSRATVATARAGYGYHTHSGNFRRLTADTAVRVTDEYAKPGYVIAYALGTDERMHIQRRALLLPEGVAALAKAGAL